MSDTYMVPQGGPVQGDDNASSYSKQPYEAMSEGEIVQQNNQWFDRCTGSRAHIEKHALLNIAFFLGQQYVGLPEGEFGSRLVRKPTPKGRIRTTENIIKPTVRSEMARLLRSRPTGVTLPLGDDPEDIEAAQAGDDILQHVRREYGREEHTEQAVAWAAMAGTSHVGINFDPMARDPDGIQGALEYRVLSPFEFGVPKLREQDIEKQPYVMVTKMYEVDEIEMRWGIRVSGDDEAVASALDDRMTSIIQGTAFGDSSFSNAVMSGHAAGKSSPKYAVVKETWVKPNPSAPDGAVIITAGNSLLDLTPWPAWTKGRYPFSKYVYISVPGSYWGQGLIDDLIPIQRRHNRALSIVIETMNLYAMLSVAAPKNTKVKGILGGRGTLFETPLGATQPALNVQPPPIGELPFRELENTRLALRDISSQHEVSKGFTPPNVRSGTAINLLKEIDDSASILAQRSIERAEEKLGRHTLEIVKHHWKEPRLVMILGKDGDIERRSFITGDDVGGQFVVQTGTAWPYAKAEKIQHVLDLFREGLIDPMEALGHLDLGATSASIMKSRNEDQRHARRENQKFEALSIIGPNGQPDMQSLIMQARALAPEMWHNHMAHLHEHNRLRKSPRYETWPLAKRMAYEAHIEGHMAALAAQMAPAANAEAGTGPAPKAAPAQEGEA